MRDITRNRFSLKGVRLSLFAGLFQLPIFRSFCILLLSAGMILALAITAFAGPPFLTDDPNRWNSNIGRSTCLARWIPR